MKFNTEIEWSLLHKLDMWYGRRVCCASVSKKYFYPWPKDIFEIHVQSWRWFVVEIIFSFTYIYIYLSSVCDTFFLSKKLLVWLPTSDWGYKVYEKGKKVGRNWKSKYSESKLHCKFIGIILFVDKYYLLAKNSWTRPII